RLAALESQLESLIQTRKAKEELLRSAEKMQEDLRQHRRTVDLLQSAFDEAQADLEKIEDRLKNRQEQANKHRDVITRAEDIEKAYQEWQTFNHQLSELEQQE
ncbi:coiled-coil domain-containing protein 22, partial [candidate division KSB1 bacterium]|nr:coiled-coil domain-containing protein 22 [candidate division KSB1 bacterium]NIU25715.1 coiled-coil domain-containing protein 22 [candidate division KSB1 bacterium]NIW19562.1 hypothetical protein [candidate division KSB1 bacterium]